MFEKLFKKFKKPPPEPVKPEPNHPYMVENCVFGSKDGVFVNPQKGIRKVIIDKRIGFIDFPGIENPSLIIPKLRSGKSDIPTYVDYNAKFHYQNDGTHLVKWELQPDGRYFEDESGFGAESCEEITLYTYLDEDGCFTAPFRIYNIGMDEYFGTDREDELCRKNSENET